MTRLILFKSDFPLKPSLSLFTVLTSICIKALYGSKKYSDPTGDEFGIHRVISGQ